MQNLFGHELDGYGYTYDPLGLRTNLTRYLGITSNSVAVELDNEPVRGDAWHRGLLRRMKTPTAGRRE